MNSPEYVQTSLAAALSLGMEKGRFKDRVKLYKGQMAHL